MADKRRENNFKLRHHPYDKKTAPSERDRKPRSLPPFSSDQLNHSVRESEDIDPRVRKERPCRTLFVRNVDYSIPKDELARIFSKHGEIKSIFDLISQRGMAFITFYDLRAAETAKMTFQGKVLGGRRIDVHFSLPKESDVESTKCDREKNQGTLFLTIRNLKEPIKEEEVERFFNKFGEVKVVRPYRNHYNQKFIEFWDSRSCIQAHDEARKQYFYGYEIDLKFAWDRYHTVKGTADVPFRGPSSAEIDNSVLNTSTKLIQPAPHFAESNSNDNLESVSEVQIRLQQAQKAQQLLASLVSPPNSGSFSTPSYPQSSCQDSAHADPGQISHLMQFLQYTPNIITPSTSVSSLPTINTTVNESPANSQGVFQLLQSLSHQKPFP